MSARRLAVLTALLLAACGGAWNDPYPDSERGKNIYYSSFITRPKTLDPARSYTVDEWEFIVQVYEPPLQYHYLKRPYELIPLAGAEMPNVRYLDANGAQLPEDAAADKIAFSDYEIHIKPGILFQPHPAFAKDAVGKPLYLGLSVSEVQRYQELGDFPRTGTRELVAEDYVYQIKRLAHPRLDCPVLGHLSGYIVGLKELTERLRADYRQLSAAYKGKYGNSDPGYPWLDLRRYELSGVTVLDRYTYRIRLKGKYQQFLYWLAMPFFAPLPVEADEFYSQRGMNDGRNISLDWYPVGTGGFMLTENNPNARMVLARNPNYRGAPYPSEGAPGDREAGLLIDAGKRGPFIDAAVFSREKEAIPLWNKFLQGYYDRSGISSDTFDQAVSIGYNGQATLTDEMERKGIRLETSIATETFYLAFNFLDPVVGGFSEQARKLRQAVSIAIDWEEFISIFANGRGIPGMGPLPPGIFGYQDGEAGINPVVYDWANGAPRRKPIAEAKKLLAEAGYPDGQDARSGAPLVLYLDTVSSGPESKSRLDWYRSQFAKLNIQLEIRATDWNRFQDKILHGRTQLFFLGWNADYPDPENFMFLLYGPQSRVKSGGDNAANYESLQFDALFQKMKNVPNGPERMALIRQMVSIAREDAPWVWGYHPKDFTLTHQWLTNVKPSHLAPNGLKFYRIGAALREQKRLEWNRPVLWPLFALVALLIASVIPAYRSYRRRELSAAR